MDIDIFKPEQWHDFFVMVGGGAAALAGSVFVAMSVNLTTIAHDTTHKNRAVATLTGFTAVFMICAFALIGNQNFQWIGVEMVGCFACSHNYLHTCVLQGQEIGQKLRGAQHGSLHRGNHLLRSSDNRLCSTDIRTCCRALCGLRSYGALFRFFYFRRVAPHHWRLRKSG